MEKNAKSIENEDNNAFLDDEQQLEEPKRKIQCRKGFSDEVVSGQSSRSSIKLKNCNEVHVGPKFECHHYAPTSSDPNKFDLLKNPIFVKCKEKLKSQYMTNFAYMRSFFWDGKRNDLPIKDHFVELIVEKSNLFGKKEGEKISLEEIFSNNIEGHQTILLSGGSGYGKTTLCKKIAYDWATKGKSSNYLEHFDLAVVILLRELGDKSLYDLLLYNIFRNATEEVKSEIEKENLYMLVMLDGFDEITNKSEVVNFIRDESFIVSSRMTILVTSRPQATEDIREDMMSRFSVEGFSEQQQQKYIKLMFKDYEDKGKKLSEMLKVKESFREMKKCPLILHMICCLYLHDDRCLNEGITDLYIRIISLLIKRYISKSGCNYKFKKGKYFLGEDLLIRLGESRSFMFTDLKTIFPVEEEYNFIVGLGILEFVSFSAFDEKAYYQFMHLSFYEFIRALYSYYGDYVPNICDICTDDNILLFVMGLSGEEPFPETVQDIFKMRYMKLSPAYLYQPYLMLKVYREIKIKTNWDLFCSLSHLVFSYRELNNVKALLSLYTFTRMHFMFPENKCTYEIFRDKLIDFFKNIHIFDKLVIFLFAGNSIINSRIIENKLFFAEKGQRDAKIHEHLEVMSCIIDFFNRIGPLKHKIYLSGVVTNMFARLLYFFRNIEYSLEISEKQKENLNAEENEKFVALQICNESEPHFVDYVISAKQYEILRDRIKIFPLSDWKHTFMTS